MYTGKKSVRKKKNIHREGKTFSIQLYLLVVSGDINISLPLFSVCNRKISHTGEYNRICNFKEQNKALI